MYISYMNDYEYMNDQDRAAEDRAQILNLRNYKGGLSPVLFEAQRKGLNGKVHQGSIPSKGRC